MSFNNSELIIDQASNDIKSNVILKSMKLGSMLEEQIENVSYLNDDAHEFIKSVVDGVHRSAIVYGQSGMGKTHVVINSLKEKGLKEGVDFVVVRSHVTPLMLYIWLYLMREEGKFVILDDCDGVLNDEKGLNLIKAATDNNLRQMSWFSTTQIFNPLNKKPVPDTFEFKGSLIITTNLTPSEGRSKKANHMDAIRSRAVQFSFNINDKESQLAQIIYMICIKDYLSNNAETSVNEQEKTELLKFLIENHSKARRLDLRLPQTIAREIKSKSDNWKRRSLRFLEAA